MKKILVLFALLSTLCAGAQQADIDQILSSIVSNNIDLKLQKANVAGEIARRSADSGLQSDPTIDGEFLISPNDYNKFGIGISQAFDWPGFYAAQTKSVNAANRASQHSVDAATLSTVMDARQLCIDIIDINRKLILAKKTNSLFASLIEKGMVALDKGEITILDTNKFKIEQLNAQIAEDNLNSELLAKINELKGLNGGQDISSNTLRSLTEYPETSLLALNDYLQIFETTDPNLQYLSAKADALSKEVSAAKMKSLPGFNLGYKYAREDGGSFNGITFGMNIPLFSNRGKVDAAKAEALAASIEVDKLQADRSSQIVGDHARATLLKSNIAKYKDVLNDASYIQLLEKAYFGGQITAFDLVLDMQYYTQAQNDLHSLEHEYFTIENSLNRYQLMK